MTRRHSCFISTVVLVLSGLFATAETSAQLFSTLEGQSGSHFRVGVSARKIGIRYSYSPVAPLDLSSRFATPSGPGDVGFFTATSGPVVYEDGRLDSVSQPGLVDGVINGIGQVRHTNRFAFGVVSLIDRVTFSSSETDYSETFTDLSSQGAAGSEEEAAMPYVEWVLPLIENDDRFLRFVAGYHFLSTGSETRPELVGLQTLDSLTTTYLYHYDHLGVISPTDQFPLNTGVILFDVALATFPGSDIGGDLLDPTGSRAVSRDATSVLALSRSRLDVDLHEIPLGLEWGRRSGRGEWALRGGITLNAVDLDLVTRTDWVQAGSGRLLASTLASESGSEFACGAYLGASVTWPLNEDGSVYLRAHGTYHWVDEVSISASHATATVELSSWEGGLGIGIVFE